jgi:predicted secreted protein
MGTKSSEVIWGGKIMGADIRAKHAREEATKAADRAEAEAWSVRIERRTSAAITDHQAMPQWRLKLAGGRVQSLQGPLVEIKDAADCCSFKWAFTSESLSKCGKSAPDSDPRKLPSQSLLLPRQCAAEG